MDDNDAGPQRLGRGLANTVLLALMTFAIVSIVRTKWF
jgi:hypothetical protein